VRTSVPAYRRHRFPCEITSQLVWLYFCFSWTFRDVEGLMYSRGVALTYETVREWCLKFDQIYAKGLRRRSPPGGAKGHSTPRKPPMLSGLFHFRLEMLAPQTVMNWNHITSSLQDMNLLRQSTIGLTA
jgi:hypothetical protein